MPTLTVSADCLFSDIDLELEQELKSKLKFSYNNESEKSEESDEEKNEEKNEESLANLEKGKKKLAKIKLFMIV